jgi:hypothetical protein
MPTALQKVSVSFTLTEDVELPNNGPVWKLKSERATLVGGYALTMADVTIPKLPAKCQSCVQ